MADLQPKYIGGYQHIEETYNWFRKDGKLRKRPETLYVTWYTELQTCQRCGKLGTPKKIHCRNDVYGWNLQDGEFESKSTLCMACWNVVRPLVQREHEAMYNKRLINKLQREISDAKKRDQDNGSTA